MLNILLTIPATFEVCIECKKKIVGDAHIVESDLWKTRGLAGVGVFRLCSPCLEAVQK